MKKITIAYWKDDLQIPHFDNNKEFEYSNKTRNEILDIILDLNYSVMLRPNMGIDKDILLIYINNGRFVQS